MIAYISSQLSTRFGPSHHNPMLYIIIIPSFHHTFHLSFCYLVNLIWAISLTSPVYDKTEAMFIDNQCLLSTSHAFAIAQLSTAYLLLAVTKLWSIKLLMMLFSSYHCTNPPRFMKFVKVVHKLLNKLLNKLYSCIIPRTMKSGFQYIYLQQQLLFNHSCAS